MEKKEKEKIDDEKKEKDKGKVKENEGEVLEVPHNMYLTVLSKSSKSKIILGDITFR